MRRPTGPSTDMKVHLLRRRAARAAERAIRCQLLFRWAMVVEEDHQTEGFWEDCAKALGLTDTGLVGMTDAQERYIRRFVNAEVNRLRRRAHETRRTL